MGFDSRQKQKFYPASLRSFWLWGSPNLLPNGRRGAKLLEREADSSHLSSAEFKNVGSLTFTLPMPFHAVMPGHKELYFYFCPVHVLHMSWIQCLLVGRLPEWRRAVRICFNGQFVCCRYDRWNIRNIPCGGIRPSSFECQIYMHPTRAMITVYKWRNSSFWSHWWQRRLWMPPPSWLWREPRAGLKYERQVVSHVQPYF